MFKRLVVAALVAATALAVVTTSASANRSLSVSPGGATRETSEGMVTFEEPGILGVACNLTLNSTTPRSIAKRAGTHMGSITEGRASECRDTIFGTAATAIVLVEVRRPFTIVYNSFLGTLPNITGILGLQVFAIRLSSLPGDCLFATNTGVGILWAVGAGGVVRRKRYLINLTIPLSMTISGSCPGDAEMQGTMSLSPGQTIRLI